ncbi:MAG: sulfite exporter TauE/SafE family protein [Bacteroidota bacterium]
MDYLIFAISLIASFIFAMGGVGTASVMVPILVSLGVPLNIAKPTGLFNNTISMISASISNIKNGRLDYKIGIPLIVFSFLFAVVGAYASQFIPTMVILILFVLFLVFSGLMFIFFKRDEYEEIDRKNIPYLKLSIIGSVAGLMSGLLGIGGGGVISPAMLMLGFNPKKTTVITAFVIPFSSFSAFVTYWLLGNIDWKLILIVTSAGIIGATLGTSFMHKRLDPNSVRRLLAVILLAMAVNLIYKIV